MKAKRKKIPASFYLDAGLMERLERWIATQKVPPSKTAAVEFSIREMLDREEVKAA